MCINEIINIKRISPRIKNPNVPIVIPILLSREKFHNIRRNFQISKLETFSR